jgi:hypothetical protein
MARSLRPGRIVIVGFWAALVALLGVIAGYHQPVGTLTDYGYWTCLVVFIFLYGQAAATATYYDFQEGPEAAGLKTESEMDSEGRRRASITFEKGIIHGLLAAGIPGFLAWLLTHIVF